MNPLTLNSSRYDYRAGRASHHETGGGKLTIYGYRLFGVEVHNGFKRTPLDFTDCDGKSYVDIAYPLLKGLNVTVVGKPKIREGGPSGGDGPEFSGSDQDDLRGEEAFRIERLSRSGNVIRGRIYRGIFGDHPEALGVRGNGDVDLKERAPSRLFYFALALPEQGKKGVLAVEAISRTCPVDLIVAWLNKKSKENSVSIEIDEQGDEVITQSAWWRITAHQLGDEQHLNEVLSNGRAGKVELVKHEVAHDRIRVQERFTISAPVREGGLASSLHSVIKGWWDERHGSDRPESATDDAQGASQLAAIVGPDIQGIDFDDGWIRFEDRSGVLKVSPSRLPEIFTYFLGDSEQSEKNFYENVRDRSVRLSLTFGINLTWPDYDSPSRRLQ